VKWNLPNNDAARGVRILIDPQFPYSVQELRNVFDA
jgi:hypothetical protein